MKKDKDKQADTPTIRRQAEKQLKSKKLETKIPTSKADQMRLLHELQVHQIELGMQNEELRLARNEMEKLLSEFSDLYDFAPVGYFTVDRKGVITKANLAAGALVGMERSRLIRRSFSLLVRNDMGPAVDTFLRKTFESNTQESHETILLKEGGQSRWIHIEGKAFNSGEQCRLAVVDITDRKIAEDALRESEERYRSYLEVTGQVSWATNALGQVVEDLPTWTRFTGQSEEEIKGSGWARALHPQDVGHILNTWHNAIDTNSVYEVEYSIRRHDGVYRDFLARGVPVFKQDESIRGWVGACVDITKRKQAEDGLRESEERYRTAIENAIDGITLVKEDQHIYVNTRFVEMFGYEDPSDIIGKPLSLTVHPDDLEMVSEINRMRQAGKPVPSRYEFKGIRKDGITIFIEVSAAKTNYRGEPVSLVYLRDITEYKNLAEQLHQSQKMEAIGTLAGGIAHDFNNILAAIIGFSEMIDEDLPDSIPSKKRVKRVLGAAYRGKDLVRQILAFSRKADYVRNPVSLFPIIEETCQLLKASLPSTIEVIFDTTATSDTILATAGEVQQIFLNLGTNAALSMREKGGVLHILLSDIDLKDDALSLETDMPPETYVQITVEDTGTGMSPDVMQRIFEPYFTTREVGKGTGMGLAMVYGIVKSLHGTITVESKPGIGSVFRVFLAKVTAEPQPESVKTGQISRGKERVLFIDDEELLAVWGKELLERLGYEVTALTDSMQAFDIFSSDPARFDLVITDQTMPHMTGLHLTRELLKIRPDLPVILCTGYSDSVSPEIAKEARIREFLVKPLGKQMLAEAIRRVLGTKDSEG